MKTNMELNTKPHSVDGFTIHELLEPFLRQQIEDAVRSANRHLERGQQPFVLIAKFPDSDQYHGFYVENGVLEAAEDLGTDADEACITIRDMLRPS